MISEAAATLDCLGSSPPVSAAAGASLSDGEEDEGACGGGYSTFSSDQSTSEDSSLTSDSDRTLVGDPPEEDRLSDRCNSPEYHNVSSPEEDNNASSSASHSAWASTAAAGGAEEDSTDVWAGRTADDHPVRKYFKWRTVPPTDDTEDTVLSIRVDKRMTVDQLKEQLQSVIGVSAEHFKLYKKYIQEFECSVGSDQVKNFGESCKLAVKLDRALQQGEFRGKLYLLDANNIDEPFRFLIEWVLRNGQTVGQAKLEIIKEVNETCNLSLDPDKVRLRKKSWKNPQTVHLNHHVFGDDINLYRHWELFLQEIEGPELKTESSDEEVLVFVRRFRPSQYKCDAIVEILLKECTADCLKQELSRLSEIPPERIEFAKGRGAFPCDMSVLEIPTELDWKFKGGSLEDKPYNILDDGALLYYR